MGLLKIFKSKQTTQETTAKTTAKTTQKILSAKPRYADASAVAPDEKPYYQPDEYYTLESFPGTEFAQRVITYDERKRTSCPTSNGLYIADVMLLEYCSHGDYPKPRDGYPGLWWFQFGIRDVGHALESLEERGFLQWAPKKNYLQTLKADELKNILQNANLPVSGKKVDLIDRVIRNVSEEKWLLNSYTPKYELTERGKTELENNGYIPYMVNHPRATVEDATFGEPFNVWQMNKHFRNGHAENWRAVIGQIEKDRFGMDIAEIQKDSPKKEKSKERTTTAKSNNTEKQEEIRAFLASNRDAIARGINNQGDGLNEEMNGIALKKAGKDKEALVQFYIAIGKSFFAPALYNQAAILLHKYGMYEEELDVINAGLRNVVHGGEEELEARKAKVLQAIEKNKSK